MIETGEWEQVTLAPIDTTEGKHGNWVAVVGMSAAHRGDTDGAKAAEARLRALSENAEAGGNQYDARQNAILENQVASIRLLKSGDSDGAVAAAKSAAEMEIQYMRVPSGPPKPMKPANELYAQVLLAADRPKEAMAAFQQSLAWMPLRTPSMMGLAKAAEKVGDNETAHDMYTRLKTMPGAQLMD
jgi:predicted Zn-dependent protease